MTHRVPWLWLVALQLVVVGVFGVAYGISSPRAQQQVVNRLVSTAPTNVVDVSRSTPLVIEPLYDRPELVSDAELAAVLERVVPRFDPLRTSPNWIEHALRIWGIDAEFADPQAMSGRQMMTFLTDHGQYAVSWGEQIEPLLEDRPGGIAVRWGRDEGASVHHDHWLASLTEAGVPLDEPVYGPGRRAATINDVLQEALRDFRLDERETEWTAMAFGLWLPPTRTWTGNGGRQYSFDLLAARLMRGQLELGVCSGTHRVYSLMVLLRLDAEYEILSEGTATAVYAHLEQVRDLITVSQWEDGRWPSNWPDGESAARDPIDEDVYKQVIATGHHLEWLAIAPAELHPPEEQIRKAARWVIDETTQRTAAQVLPKYTFFSHVGNALALWRKTHPAEFYQSWRASHPFKRTPENTVEHAKAAE